MIELYGTCLNLGIYVSTLGGYSTKRTHTVHRTTHPAYPPRAPVERVDWGDEYPSYSPVNFTHSAVLENDCSKNPKGWADPAEITPLLRDQIANRVSNALEVGGKVLMVDGLPRNPIGRTGMTGRGLLGKYGPNYAADPLVTRFDPETLKLQMVAIQRSDTKQWAIPGGMVDAGETVSTTLKREFTEEAQSFQGKELDDVQNKLEMLFATGGRIVYVGYVDDPRNTDNSWMETTCVHFHIEDPFLAEHMRLEAGDDASKARWLFVSDSEADFLHLYASHRDMVIRAILQESLKFRSTIKLLKL
jgi:ADP-ribose pyrophosphatase